ncbi:MAG: aspartyl-trna synthetase [Parvularculaceae bacterium]|nr:aspartyl-trna synthetase [Parvularculaceae bacterium]
MRRVPHRLGWSLALLGTIFAVSSLSQATAAEALTVTNEASTRIGFSGLPVPRFVALKKEKVYGRIGPSLDVDVAVVYRRQGLPVKVVAETKDNSWRKVEDHTGRQVWIHHSMLMENKSAIVRDNGVLFSKPDRSALPRARLEPGVVAKLEKCEANWCQIKAAGFRGWTSRENLWGSPLSELK